jgi:hypothetical protein
MRQTARRMRALPERRGSQENGEDSSDAPNDKADGYAATRRSVLPGILQPTRLPLQLNCGLRRVPFYARRVAPKVLETVKGAFGLMEDMNNYL